MIDADRLVLEIADRFYLAPGSRDRAIREELGLSPTLFWQHVNQLLDNPAAALEYPEVVNRLRRLRDRRLGRRAA